MIWFNGFPFLDTKEEHTFHVSVSSVMTHSSSLSLLPATGLSLRSLEGLLAKSPYSGFPVVEDRISKVLLGYIGRTELRYAIDRTKREGLVSPQAKCLFASGNSSSAATTPATAPAPNPAVTFDAIASSSGTQLVDFSRFVDPTPLAVHPRLPLETVMELFKKMGPRVILVEYRGKLMGLVTVKDCLKYQFKVEAQGNGRHESREDEAAGEGRDEWLWRRIRGVGERVGDLIGRISRGRIELRATGEGSERLLGGGGGDPRDERESIPGSQPGGILDGTEDDDGEGLELRER